MNLQNLMASECEDSVMHEKYMQVSNVLFDLFMTEHNNIGEMFRRD